MKVYNSPTEISLEAEKKNFLNSISRGEIANNFPLFITRQKLAQYLVRHELFKKILKIKGSIVECGVYKGSSLMFFANLSAVYEPYAYNREIIGFDTFAGFPNVDNNKDSPYASANPHRISDEHLETLKKSIKFYDNNRPIGHLPKVKLVKGDASETIPKFFAENPFVIVALLFLDFDLYEPTKTALKTILPRMPKGGIIAFDELNEERWPGETVALLEMANINNYEIKKFPEEPQVSYIRL